MVAVAFAYQRSPLGRKVRATREDPAAAQAVGISVHRQRLWAFTLSGALCGFAGGLLVHMLGSITTEQVYLELTFLTLAMLVVGGITSLWGAVVGALAVSGLDSLLGNAEDGSASASARPAGGLAAGRPRRADGADADPAPVRDHRRTRAAAAAEGRHEGLRRRVWRRRVSLFAANLASLDDVEVWAYDLAEAHVDAINERGLRLTGAGEVHATGIRATSDAAELPACDFGIVATKAMHTEAAIAATAHAFADGAVASVQNGVGNEEAIAAHVARVIRGTTFPAGKILEPGVVQWDVQGRHDLRPVRAEPGARRGDRAARRRLHAAAACRRRAVADARGAQWRKVIFNASTNPIGALTGLTHGRVCERPDLRALVSGPRGRGQGGRGGAGDRARRRPRGADRPRRAGPRSRTATRRACSRTSRRGARPRSTS